MADWTELEALGLDTQEGLACCAEDPEFYEEMLGEYCAEGEGRARELAAFYAARDWHNYGIRAHAAKSSSRMIGAAALAERARELEFAAKARDEAALAAGHEGFLAAYSGLLEALRALL